MNLDISRLKRPVVAALVAALLGACSIQKLAVDAIGNSMADGADVYASENDPDLVREALPFGLKTFESLLAVSPDNRNILLGAAKGFTGYAFLLQQQGDIIDRSDHAGAQEIYRRARLMYLRGRDYALRGLSVAHPGLPDRLRRDPDEALAITTLDDVPTLYWAGAAWAAAIGAGPIDLGLVAELPIAASLVRRVLELDEGYDRGAAHEFFISLEGSRPGGSARQARIHYDRALALSRGVRASVYVSLAEAVTVREQNLDEFRALLGAARAVDPNAIPELRLANTLARRRAGWLESRIPDLFLESERKETGQ